MVPPSHRSAQPSSDFEELPSEPRRHPIVWVVYAVLYALAIPWYWPDGYRGPLVLGLPTWVAVTAGSVVLLGIWTCFVIRRYWQDEFQDEVGP
ncbi:MAG: hypothetical protein VX733_00645 [Candidatus Latescibacterota bacterium]|nr:hypothetical protein [Candidatus Latescibacterota bacterium]